MLQEKSDNMGRLRVMQCTTQEVFKEKTLYDEVFLKKKNKVLLISTILFWS